MLLMCNILLAFNDQNDIVMILFSWHNWTFIFKISDYNQLENLFMKQFLVVCPSI